MTYINILCYKEMFLRFSVEDVTYETDKENSVMTNILLKFE